MLELTGKGFYCPAGDFHIDPWAPAGRAVITHAHSDHARPGSSSYLCTREGHGVLRARLGDVPVQALEYGETVTIGDARVSLHPAGHILGSAQVRVEVAGRVACVSGDYKTSPDPTAAAFEPVPCHLFVTEATFALPVYRWRPDSEIFEAINAWWARNAALGRTSVLYGYALGKAQRLLSGLDPATGPILLHGAVEKLVACYRQAGITLPAAKYAGIAPKEEFKRAIVLAPPSANGTPWVRRFGDFAAALASGWMAIRGARRRRAVDRGFVLSDHADWPGLLAAIDATEAEEVWVTHGYTSPLTRWLNERGWKTRALATRFEGELIDREEDPAP